MSTVFITEDAKYYSDTPSSKLETVGPTLVISTKTSKLRLAFASLKALKIALFEIMLLHAWAEWYYHEGILHGNIPDSNRLQEDTIHRYDNT